MARSQYIYVVEELRNWGARLVCGFTVKHELVSWLKSNPGSNYRVTRIRDGRLREDNPAVLLDLTELLA